MFTLRYRYYCLLAGLLFLLSGGLSGEVTQARALGSPAPHFLATGPAHQPATVPDSTHSAQLSAISTFEHSLTLDGDGDYVEIAHDPALNLTDGNGLTIEAWIRRANTDGCHTVISKGYQTAYSLDVCPDVRLWSAGTGQSGSTQVPAGVWTHVAVVQWPDNQVSIYINGELDYSGTAGAAPGENTAPVFIGAEPPPAGELSEFAGDIAEVRLWNVARGQNAIRRTMHLALDEPLPGLVAVWRLSDDYRDSIGGHDGTPRGGASLSGPEAPPQPAFVPVDEHFNTLPATRYAAATAYIPHLDQALLVGGVSDGGRSDTIDVVDASTGAVSPLDTLPSGLMRATATYVPDMDIAYVFGGWDRDNSTRTDRIYAVSPTAGLVDILGATLLVPTDSAAAVYHAGLGRIYILGGYGGGQFLDTISVFDPTTGDLFPADFALPSPRYGMTAAYSSATERIYYFGGADSSTYDTDSIYEITLNEDGNTGTVSRVTSASLPRSSSGLTAVEDPVSKLIYLVGGSLDSVVAFDPVTGELWQTRIQLPHTRRHSSVVYSYRNRHVVMMGGMYGGSGQSNVWRIPLGDGPAVPLGRWDFPQPVGAEVIAIDGDERAVGVATWGDGLWHYRHDGLRSQYTALTLGSTYVHDVRYNAPNDDLWAATDDAGGKLIDGGSITTYDSSLLGSNRVYAVDVKPGYTDSDGAAFFGTDQAVMWQPFGAGSFWDARFWGTAVKAITHRGTGDLWAIAQNNPNLERMVYSDGNLSEFHYGEPCGSKETLRDLAFAPNGDWWIASGPWGVDREGGGVCRIPSSTTPGPGSGSLMVPAIGREATSVDVDADGRIWFAIGTDGEGENSGGLVAYEAIGSPVTLRTEEMNWLMGPVGSRVIVPFVTTKLWDSTVTAVGAADERVWAGKNDGRLVTLAQRWQQLSESNSLGSKAIQGVWMVRGRAFLATSNSLHVLAPDGQSWDNRSGVQVLTVLGDRKGRIWVGTDADVRLYTPSGWDMLTTAEGTKPTGAINALAEDHDGRIWIGGENGLTLYDRERFVATFTSDNSDLPSDWVQSLLVDRDNRLWVGTDNSLARLDGSDWTVFTPADGLPNTQITDLAQLGDGRIAISTYRICGEVPCTDLYLYDGSSFSTEAPPSGSSVIQSPPLTVDELGRLWAGSAVLTANGWQGYYWTNSGLRSSTITDVAADSADRVWFAHAPDTGVSVRGALLPPLADTFPSIAGISPDHGSSGDLITINGTGFGSNPADVDVTVGGAAVEVMSVSDAQIRVRLKETNTSGAVSVSVGGRRIIYSGSGRPAFCAEPVISTFTPTGGNNGVQVDIRGTNFDAAAMLQLGSGGTSRKSSYNSPTRLFTAIQAGDTNGPIQVTNACPGGPSYTGTSSGEFRHINLTLEKVVLNQGLASYGFVTDRPTFIQHYLSHSIAPRNTDRLEVDTVEVTFSQDGVDPRTYTTRFPTPVNVPHSSGPPSEALLKDIVNSVNVSVTPRVRELISSRGGNVQVRAVLKRNGQTVAEITHTVRFRPNLPLRVLLVPIMKEGYTAAELQAMKQNVNADADELRRRIFPTGRVALYWSPVVYTNKTCCFFSDDLIDINNVAHLYDAAHALDRARRQWNARHDPDALIVFGVLHQNVRKSGRGQALWPDLSDLVNKIGPGAVDMLCDVGNGLLKVLTLGLAGSDEGCHLEIPLYVGWAYGNDTRISAVFGHEMGHIMGLVKPDAPNGDLFDNITHSVNDELHLGECGSSIASYVVMRTLYRQPGVTDPVVNPISKKQFRPQLTKDDQGNPADENTNRGKAIMSYACADDDDNVYFEPVDMAPMFREFGISSVRNFIHDLTHGRGLTAATVTNVAEGERLNATANDTPVPRPVAGERLYVSGVVNKATDTGELRRVEVLGESAPLDVSYATGYWLVQLDEAGDELDRTGIYPSFASTAAGPLSDKGLSAPGQTGLEHDEGFFATTLLLQDTVARLQLRHNDDVLDEFTAGNAAPSVNISSPAGGSFGSGTIPVTWTAADTDGDPLEITIDYSADGGATWTPVAFGSNSDTVEVPVAVLAGSDDARFRVTASDGFHVGNAISALFSVANQPPQPYIGQPLDDNFFLEGQPITLSGGADDNQDGSVADAGLRWYSDRDGELGTGSTLNVFLSVGTHILTLDAENSVGLRNDISIVVTIAGDYDFDGIPDAEELAGGLNPLTEKDAYSDDDEDGLPLIMERKWGLNPDHPDSDEDGRGDAEEIATGSDPATPDDPLPPDELHVDPASLGFEADLSLDTPLPQRQVQVTSREPTAWTLTADVEWLAASADTGQTPAGPTILVDAYLLEDGVHTGNLTFASVELDSAVQVPVVVTITNRAAYYDTNGDGAVDVVDIMQVAARFATDNSQEGFSYRYDLDRDGDIDVRDIQLIAQRWRGW